MMMESVFWWRKPEHPEETTDLRQEGRGGSSSCHRSCYSSYTSQSRNQSSTNTKKRKATAAADEAHRVLKSQAKESNFNFKRLCLFCGKECLPKDPKYPDHWDEVKQYEKLPIKDSKGRELERNFKTVVEDICDQRQDEWGREVALRLCKVQTDLPAYDCQYHSRCYHKFRRSLVTLPKLTHVNLLMLRYSMSSFT